MIPTAPKPYILVTQVTKQRYPSSMNDRMTLNGFVEATLLQPVLGLKFRILGCSDPQYEFVTIRDPLLIKRLPCLPPSIGKDGAENILGGKAF